MSEKNSTEFVINEKNAFKSTLMTMTWDLSKTLEKQISKVIKIKRAGRKHANSFDGWLRRRHGR